MVVNYICVFYHLFVPKILILTLVLFLFNCCVSCASVITESNDEYVVRGVTVKGADFDNEQSLKQNALFQAKRVAFDDLLKHLKAKDVFFDETNINAMISSYNIIDEYYNGNYYTMVANFVFNKTNFQLFLKSNDKVKDSNVNCVVTIRERNDIVEEYVKLRDVLNKEKISFRPLELSSTEVKISLENVSKNRVYELLKTTGINGTMRIID